MLYEVITKYLPYDYHGDYTGSGEEYWQLRTRSINGETINLSENDVRFWRAVYDAKIYAADQRFGKFIEQLKTRITSYNVCYTKLLRSFHLQLPGLGIYQL